VKSSLLSLYALGIAAALALMLAAASACDAQGSRYEQFAKTYPQFANPTSWGPSSRGFRLAIVSVHATYIAGEPIDIFALIRNSDAAMEVTPIESWGFETTLVEANSKQMTLKDAGEPINSTGLNEIGFDANTIVETTLHIGARYNLAADTYRLTASYDIRQGSSMDAESKPVFAHLVSNPITIRILPAWTPAPLRHARRRAREAVLLRRFARNAAARGSHRSGSDSQRTANR
jgi:hypothetical protein